MEYSNSTSLNEKTIFLYGAGGHARVVKDIIEKCRRNRFYANSYVNWEKTPVTRLVDDNEMSMGSFPWDEARKIALEQDSIWIITIGDNKIRELITKKVREPSFEIASALIHPSAITADNEIGYGTVIMAGAVIQPGARIGNGCIINTGATIDHDCIIGDFVHIAPGANLCGNVVVGDRTLIGVGASVIPNIGIGEDCIVGAGGAVVNNLKSNTKVLGVPAREASVSG